MFSGERKVFIFSVTLGLVLLGASFLGGYYAGSRGVTLPGATLNVQNKEPSVITNADFGPFWKAWEVLSAKYVSKEALPTEDEKVWGAISGLAQSYKDPYTVFFPPEEAKAFEEDISGEFQGVGMEIGIRERILTVITPLKGSPAERAGIRAGDRIFKIDETVTQDMPVDKAVKLIRGAKGTVVTLSLIREGLKEPLVVKVTRDTITIPTIDTELRKDGIFVIRLYNFSANSPSLFQNALREFVLSGSSKLILDLRGNPGGYLEAAVDMASWFLPAGKVVVREDAGTTGEKVYRSRGYDVFNSNLKMVILVNQGSASASEILAGALSEHNVATLVGEHTFGKGSVQELVKITSNTSLKVTIARWLTPNGVSISEGGLKPPIVVVPTEEDIQKLRDPQMERAVAVVLGVNVSQ